MNRRMTRQSTPGRMAGFTLIELVIAMLIVAMLAAIAIPGYSSYVRKARRTDAKSALLNLASLEERYFSTQNTYSTTSTDLGYPAWPVTITNEYTIPAPSVLAATTAAPATYTFVATATGDQVKDTQCQTFTVTSTGLQTATNSAGTDNTATCWH
jgi:type IV pilus assembly protein PilE